jgi:hypothetical protein
MNVGNKKLFNLSEVNGGIDKFLSKMEESEQQIAKYEQELSALEEQLDFAVTQDILSDGGNQKQVQNIQAKKQNYIQALETEKMKLTKIKELSTDNLRKAVPEVYQQFREDILFFQSNVEDEIFRQLSEVRKEQERLILLLNEARSQANSEAMKFNYLQRSAGYENYEYTLGGIHSDHNNPTVPYRRHPEYGKPLLNLHHLGGIKDRMRYDYVELNNLIKDENKKVPKPKVTKEDLQQFLYSCGQE